MTKPIHQSSHDPVWDDSRITAYILEELPAEQRQSFEQEMASDPALAAAVEEARQIVGDVSALYASEAKPTLSDAHRETLRQATTQDAVIAGSAERAAGGRDGSDDRYHLSGRRMLMAASVLFLLGLGSGLLLPALSDNSRRIAFSPDRPETASSDAESSRPTAQPFERAEESAEASSANAQSSTQPPDEYSSVLTDSSGSMSIDRETAEPEKKQPMSASGPLLYAPAETPPMKREEAAVAKNRSQSRYPDEPQAAVGDEKEGYGAPYAEYGNEMGGYGGRMGGDSDEMGGYSSEMGDYAVPGRPSRRGRPYSSEMGGGKQLGLAVNRAHDQHRNLNQRASTVNEKISAAPGAEPMTDQGRGPGMAGDQFQPITDNPFRRIEDHPLSTFSIDVDTASYAKVRSYLLQRGTLPRPDAVRIEELINYFNYDYAPPAASEPDDESGDEPAPPFASHVEFAACPWKPEHRLARIGIKGKEIAKEDRPAGNFVFLIDVSGSMNQSNKLPLVKQGMQLLLEQLNEQDRVAIVVYAGAAGLVLDSTPADRLADIRDALDRLRAGGSTNGGEGVQLAYNVARDHFIEGGVNRVILCTDGDFNVGTTGTDSLVKIVEEEAKGGVYLSVLGFGMGNHNDTMLEQISGRGNGNYAFIDTIDEARKVLVEQVGGTLVTIAKDVKIQVEFNPAEIAAYRLIGYENRILAKEDFNDDTKDAGEIGAGHSVTALYELVPAGETAEPMAPDVDELRYQIPSRKSELAESGEWLTVKLRYKDPDGDTSRRVQFTATDEGIDFAAASRDFQFAASVASFGMLLRNSPYKGDWTLAAVEESAAAAIGDEPSSHRSEFLQMVRKAAELSGR